MASIDARGCLTDAGLETLLRAPVGQAPPELAAHLASCIRCQERLLLRGAPRGPRKTPPPPWRVWVVVGAAILMLISVLVTLRRLAG
jgi:hypothetical protein